MNRRNAALNIRRKIFDWIDTVRQDDRALASKLERDVLVSGGCICSLLLGERVNDYDVYLRTYETTELVARYYAAKFSALSGTKVRVVDDDGRISFFVASSGVAGAQSPEQPDTHENEDAGVQPREQGTAGDSAGISRKQAENAARKARKDGVEASTGYLPVFLTSNAVTLTNGVQIIIRFYGEAEDLHTNFDFLHCTGVWSAGTGALYVNENILAAMLCKQLVFQGSLYPIAALIRVRKFLKRGWTINAGQLLKICFAINKLDLEDPEVLRDQLVGMDTAYFNALLHIMFSNDASPNKLDANTVCNTIDQIEEGLFDG